MSNPSNPAIPPISVEALKTALRVPDDQDTQRIGDLRAAAIRLVDDEALHAPNDVKNEAITRIVGYLYDAPLYSARPVNVFRNSGAEGLLRPYVERRALVV